MILAARNYQTIVTEDADLAASTNAFVSHFVALHSNGYEQSFRDYVEGYGVRFDELTTANSDTAFRRAREVSRNAMIGLYKHYGIESRRLSVQFQSSADKANEALAYLDMDLGIARAGVVMDHDRRTLAYLFERGVQDQRRHVLCTWDKLHLLVAAREADAYWEALNPAALSDLLDMVAPGHCSDGLTSMMAAAHWISEESREAGAQVWDALARYHSGDLHDADLLREAKAFKADYVVRMNRDTTYEDITRSWADWQRRLSSES
ncbi:MAG: hypothetical protein IPM94_11475 [bacterium]|nr:hypothetical protein [bacterium]